MNTVVRMPGPSWTVNSRISKTTPVAITISENTYFVSSFNRIDPDHHSAAQSFLNDPVCVAQLLRGHPGPPLGTRV